MIKPKISEIIQHRLPDWLASKPKFLSFIKEYYSWIEQEGEPLEFLRNVIEYADIDQTPDNFVDLIINKIISFIPADSVIDRKLFAKNVKSFVQTKGSDESLEFIMKAVYGEEAYRVNMSEFVLRASDNILDQYAYISIEVADSVKNNFTECIGSYLVQQATLATLKIEEVSENASGDGRTFFTIKFDPRYINGEFIVGNEVKSMKRGVDLTKVEITDYQKVIRFDSVTKSLRIISNKQLEFYSGTSILKLGGGFVGNVKNVTQVFANDLHQYDYTLDIINSVGTLNDDDETYLCSVSQIDSHITKLDFCYGTVTECIGDFEQLSPASGYYPNLPIEIRGGSGAGCTAFVGDVSTGGVDKVIVLDGGKNYRIGDPVVTSDNSVSGSGFSAYVSNVDGYGGVLQAVMQIDKINIVDGGYGYAVNDTLLISHLENQTPSTPILLTVSGVTSAGTATLAGFKILNSGKGYKTFKPVLIPYVDVTVTDGKVVDSDATIVPITGLVLEHFTYNNKQPTSYATNASLLNYNDSIVDVKIIAAPAPASTLGASSGTGATNAYLIYNGFGASFGKTVSSGQITNITVSKGGYNYVDPVIVISDSTGRGASAKAIKNSAGVITSVVVLTQGSGYSASPVIGIYDRAGEGFVAQAICTNTTIGSITGFSALTENQRGEFIALPESSYKIPYSPLSTTGNKAHLSLTYKVKRLNVSAQGDGYIVPFSVSGCSCSNGLTTVTTTQHFSNVKAGMYVSGTGIQSRTKVISVTATSNINILETQLILSKPTTQAISNAALTFDPNIIVSTGGIGSGLVLYPVIQSGQLKNVIIQNAGKDYPELSQITFYGGTTQATANLTVRNGEIVQVDFITYGTGYTTGNFSYTVNATGSSNYQNVVDAQVNITNTGSILSVDIISGGSGYTNDASTKLYIEGSKSVAANLSVSVFTGVDILSVQNNGGVNAFIISPNDNWKTVTDNTGVEQVVRLKTSNISGGTGGVISYYITPSGSLAVDKNNQPWLWISSAGSNYTTPSVSIGDGIGIRPVIILGCSKKINSVTVVSGGSGYDPKTKIVVVGTGSNAILSPKIDGVSGVTSATVLSTANTNSGYTSYPRILVDDNSFVGRISEVTITNTGSGYNKFPILKCEVFKTQQVAERYWSGNDYVYTGSGAIITEVVGIDSTRQRPAVGSKLLAVSNTIGSIKKVDQTSFGYGYNEIPEAVYPLVAILDDTKNFKYGESISHDGASSSNVGDYFIRIVAAGETIEGTLYATSDVEIFFDAVPSSYGIYQNQVLTLSSDVARFHINVAGKKFSVIAVNSVANSVYATSSENITPGEYSMLLGNSFKAPTDVVLTSKSAKIVSIDHSRNMMWISNVDNVYDYSEEVTYIAEGLYSGNDDGKTIITENFSQINENQKIIGHSSLASANILWMTKASSLPLQRSVGKTKKFFTSERGVLNSRKMRMINSLNIQDYSFEVHTGYSVDVYEKLLKNSVHPAGYHLSGVVEDVTDTTLDADNIMNVDLPLTEDGKTGDYVFLALFGTIASLYHLKTFNGDYSSKNRYKHRFSENLTVLDNSFELINARVSDFDLWNYPEYKVWYVKSDNDDNDYHINGPFANSADLYIKNNLIKTCVYTQTGQTLTVTATGHGLKTGDTFIILDAKRFNNMGKFNIFSSAYYNFNATNNDVTDIVFDTSVNKWFKCIQSYTSTGTNIQGCQPPAVDTVHWEISEGNLGDRPLTVATFSANTLTVFMPYSMGLDESVPRTYKKVSTSPILCDYTRAAAPNSHLLTAAVTNHGLTASTQSWVLGCVITPNTSFVGTYAVVGTSSAVTITRTNHGYSNGDYVNLNFLINNDHPTMNVGTAVPVTPRVTPTNGSYLVGSATANTFVITNPISISAVSGDVVLLSSSESYGRFLNITTCQTTNTFAVNTYGKGHAFISGDKFLYWKAEDVIPTFDRQMTLKNVSFELSSINMIITGLSNNHSLHIGNILMIKYGNNVKFVTITAVTTNSVTFINPGVILSDKVDMSFSFDLVDVPEVGYKSLTYNLYKTYI